MGTLLDSTPPGSHSLLKILQYGDDMKEVRYACVRLHRRLDHALNAIEKMEVSDQVPQGEALALALAKCVSCFERYHAKRLVRRLPKYQTLMDDLRAINEDIDGIYTALNVYPPIAIAEWKQQWEADRRAQQEAMEPIVLLNRLAVKPICQGVDHEREVQLEPESKSCSACNASMPGEQRVCSSCGTYVFDILGSSLAAPEKTTDSENPVADSETSPLKKASNNDDSESPESTQEDITHLLENVRTGNEDEKRVATEELAKLVVSHDEIRARIVEEGILPPLVHLLRTGTDRQKSWATNALVEVAAMNDGTRAAVAREGAIPPLVALVRDGTEEQKRLATNVLAHLSSSNDAVRVEIVREGAILPLTALVQTGTDAQKQSAANVLAHLASSNLAFKADIAKQGVIAPLVSLIRTGTDGQKIWSAHALMNLASRNDANRAEILRHGAKAPLMMLVRSGTAEQKVWAAKAMDKLSSTKAIKAKLRLGIRNFFTGK